MHARVKPAHDGGETATPLELAEGHSETIRPATRLSAVDGIAGRNKAIATNAPMAAPINWARDESRDVARRNSREGGREPARQRDRRIGKGSRRREPVRGRDGRGPTSQGIACGAHRRPPRIARTSAEAWPRPPPATADGPLRAVVPIARAAASSNIRCASIVPPMPPRHCKRDVRRRRSLHGNSPRPARTRLTAGIEMRARDRTEDR